MAKVYKEGQGKWARGLFVMAIMLGAIFALTQLHTSMGAGGQVTIPVIGFDVDYRFLVHAPLFIAALFLANYLFNRPQTADFLIDTEAELKNKVTWPSQKEEVRSSIVVVVAVIILGALIFVVDQVCSLVSQFWY